MWNKYWSILFVMVLLLSTSFSKGVSFRDFEEEKIFLSQNAQSCSHVIKDVPYVSQETDFYCTYACPTMIFKYFGCDTGLYEVLFSSGVGYSVMYSHPLVKRFIISCVGTSNWETDRRFLGSLFGLTYQEDRLLQLGVSEQQRWDLYWEKIKENVSRNLPVITIVDPSCLPSVQSAIQHLLGLPDVLWNKIPDSVFKMFPSTMTHMIVIVGFNEENKTLCYHDPSAALFGDASYGTYSWVDMSVIQESMQSISSFSSFAYMVGVFNKTENPPLSEEKRFFLSLNRNLKKMGGDPFAYDDQILATWNESNLGINALKSLYADLCPGFEHRPTTIFLYKLISTVFMYSFSYKIYRLFDRFLPSILNLSDFNEQMNYIHQLALEKHDVSNWLFNLSNRLDNETVSELCYHHALLLQSEAIVCERLAENFSMFLQKGVLLPYTKALDATLNMAEHVLEMIAIEETIIA